jgi:hypothetical protein
LKARRGSLRTTDKERTGRLRALSTELLRHRSGGGTRTRDHVVMSDNPIQRPVEKRRRTRDELEISQLPGSRGLNPLTPPLDAGRGLTDNPTRRPVESLMDTRCCGLETGWQEWLPKPATSQLPQYGRSLTRIVVEPASPPLACRRSLAFELHPLSVSLFVR